MNVISKPAIVYYSVLYIALLSTWARESFLPLPLRIAFLALVFVPIMSKKVSFYFPCLVLFLTTSLLSFAGYTFMPTEPIIYLLITIISVGFAFSKHRVAYFPYLLFATLFILTSVVNIITSGTFERMGFSLLLMLLIPMTISRNDRKDVIELLPKVIVISTVGVAVLTLLNRQLLVREAYDYDRLISGSLNYTCCTLGIGFIVAMREFQNSLNTKFWKLFSAASMVVLLITVLMEASRGAMLGVVTATILTIFGRSSKIRTKLLVTVFIVIVAIILYNNHFFDLLIYRIQNDSGTGTGRTEIWADKLNSFFNSFSIPGGLFGIGFKHAWQLGGGSVSYVGCHNDFIAFFIEYGILGLLLFFTLLGYPIFASKSKSLRSEIIPYIAYFVVTCMTLEPFSMGYMPYYFFLLFIYLRACDGGGLIVQNKAE